MPSILLKIIIILSLSAGLSTANDFGSRPVDWSSTESADFRDYVLRAFSREQAIEDNYWAHFWLNQKLLTFRLASDVALSETLALNLAADSINAFAIPGNVIAMHRGLWQFADNEAEFLSVLAHEISHITQDHFTRLSSNSNNQGFIVATGLLLSILLAQENPEAANAAVLSSIAAANQDSLNFTQAMELEADQQARKLMRAAGYDADAGRSFFQKLEQTSISNDALEFLRSHPLGTTRASRLSDSDNTPLDNTPITSFDVIRFHLLNDQSLKNFPEQERLQLQAKSSNDPNIKFARLLSRYEPIAENSASISALSDLIKAHRGFLPAYYARLSASLNLKTEELCSFTKQFESLITNQTVTTKVLETMKTASQQCQLPSKTEWQVKWMWQTGKEEQALLLLRRSLSSEDNINQAARHSALLSDFERRYQRFR